MSFIKIENITKTFNGVAVLKNVNMTIEEGSVLGILGRSGSGKSILINMLRGMKDYKPDSGRIIYNIALCPNCMKVEAPSKAGENVVVEANSKLKALTSGTANARSLQPSSVGYQ